MSSGELLLTLFVALMVFGPGKLPMLAEHLGKFYRFTNTMRHQLNRSIEQLIKEQQLSDNEKKAREADKNYH